jgi:16S rRNA (guanine527-N7)-methyltransferase
VAAHACLPKAEAGRVALRARASASGEPRCPARCLHARTPLDCAPMGARFRRSGNTGGRRRRPSATGPSRRGEARGNRSRGPRSVRADRAISGVGKPEAGGRKTERNRREDSEAGPAKRHQRQTSRPGSRLRQLDAKSSNLLYSKKLNDIHDLVGSGHRPFRDSDAVLDRQPWDQLVPHLERAGADPATAMPRLRTYARSLLLWNRGHSNLISRNDEARFVERHLLESLSPAEWLKSSGAQRWLDLGSGGGLPAIPLAIAGVGSEWTLVESRRNKTLFLRKIIEELGLSCVQIVLGRLEGLLEPESGIGFFDGFTSRATLRLAPTLSLASRCVDPGGHAFLWKGSSGAQELIAEGWKENWIQDGALELEAGIVILRFVRKSA